ncbi:MAG: SPP1 phage holin family protein [Bacillales bacterium]
MKEVLKKVDNKWVRLIILIVVFINTAGMMLGYQLLPFENEEIATGISIVALALSEIWNHWKNNSYTQSAKEADAYLKARKEKLKELKE